jgi:hypothetical protein
MPFFLDLQVTNLGTLRGVDPRIWGVIVKGTCSYADGAVDLSRVKLKLRSRSDPE